MASVYAEEFHRLGYLDIGRRLAEFEWARLRSMLRDLYEENDVRQADVTAEFGEPSLVVDKRVHSGAATHCRQHLVSRGRGFPIM